MTTPEGSRYALTAGIEDSTFMGGLCEDAAAGLALFRRGDWQGARPGDQARAQQEWRREQARGTTSD